MVVVVECGAVEGIVMVDDGGSDGKLVLDGIVASAGSSEGGGGEGGYMGVGLGLSIEGGKEGFVDKVVVYGGGHGGEGLSQSGRIQRSTGYHQQTNQDPFSLLTHGPKTNITCTASRHPPPARLLH